MFGSRQKKNVDSGSTVKTFVKSLPRVKNIKGKIFYLGRKSIKCQTKKNMNEQSNYETLSPNLPMAGKFYLMIYQNGYPNSPTVLTNSEEVMKKKPKSNNKQIFASKYLTFLPKKEELKAVLNEALEEGKKESGGMRYE